MEVVRKPIADLNPAPYNPRVISADALEGLGKVLTEFGLVEPLVWNKRTGNLVGGHQRLKALVEQGETEVDVSVVDLDSEREKALNIALNNPKLQGEFNWPALGDLLLELDAANVPLELAGYTEDSVKSLLAALDGDRMPDFEPVGEDEQSRLDQKAPVTCPECGAEFVPK